MINTIDWYRKLKKPAWAPQESTFGKVWAILYIIILVVNVYVLYIFIIGKISWPIILPFWLNLFFNFIYTPIQFGLKNNFLALVDILVILVTIILSIIIIWPFAIFIALAYIPYLIWVCIATVLQMNITYLNNKVVK